MKLTVAHIIIIILLLFGIPAMSQEKASPTPEISIKNVVSEYDWFFVLLGFAVIPTSIFLIRWGFTVHNNIESLSKLVAELKTSKDTSDDKITNLINSVSTVNTTIGDLSKLKTTISDNTNSINTIITTNKFSEQNLTRLQNELGSYIAEFNQLKSQHQSLVMEVKNSVSMLGTDISAVEKDLLEYVNNKFDEVWDETTKLDRSISTAIAKGESHDRFREDIKQLYNSLELLRLNLTRYETLGKQFDDIASNIKQYDKELTTMRSNLTAVRIYLDSLRSYTESNINLNVTNNQSQTNNASVFRQTSTAPRLPPLEP